MQMRNKYIIIGRHGVKDKENNLTPESVQSVYLNAQLNLHPIVQAEKIAPACTTIMGSALVRTTQTGRARLLGMFGVQPVPESHAQLMDNTKYPVFNGVTHLVGSGITYISGKKNPSGEWTVHGDVNEQAYFDAEKTCLDSGGEVCMRHALANRQAAVHNNVPITPYETVANRVNKSIANAVDLTREKSDLVQIIGHAFLTDAGFVSLIESWLNSPVTDVRQYGGGIKMEDYGVLTFTRNEKSGTIVNGSAFLQRYGRNRENQIFPVDLSKFLSDTASR